MQYQSKAAVNSLGVTGPLVAIIVIALGMAGIDVAADLAGFADEVATFIDKGVVIAGILTGIYGRIRATAQITGFFKAK